MNFAAPVGAGRAGLPVRPYPPRPYPPVPYQRPRRGGGSAWLVISLVVVAVVLLALLVNALSGLGPEPVDESSFTPITGVTSTIPASGSSTSPSTPSAQVTTPPANPTSRVHPPGQYNNDGFQPPAPQQVPAIRPQTWDQVDAWRNRNPLYSQELPIPVRCELDVLDFDKASAAQRQEQANAMVQCLMRVWATPVTATGNNLSTPPVYMYSSGMQSSCGAVQANYAGFYCTAEGAIFMNDNKHLTFPGVRGAGLVANFESTLAHEFGHHVQARTGILGASDAFADKDNTPQEVALLESRRVELQAQCFDGLAFASLRQSMGLSDGDMYDLFEDAKRNADPKHGSSEHQGVWWWQGASKARIAECNTWAANPADLS